MPWRPHQAVVWQISARPLEVKAWQPRRVKPLPWTEALHTMSQLTPSALEELWSQPLAGRGRGGADLAGSKGRRAWSSKAGARGRLGRRLRSVRSLERHSLERPNPLIALGSAASHTLVNIQERLSRALSHSFAWLSARRNVCSRPCRVKSPAGPWQRSPFTPGLAKCLSQGSLVQTLCLRALKLLVCVVLVACSRALVHCITSLVALFGCFVAESSLASTRPLAAGRRPLPT